MPRSRFSVLLAAVIAGLSLLAVSGMASVAYALLQRLASQDALARVTRASADAAAALDRLAVDTTRAAEQLAERPLAGASARRELDRFRAAHGLSACAVLDGATPVAASPEGWAPPGGDAAPGDAGTARVFALGDHSWLVAQSAAPGMPGRHAVTAIALATKRSAEGASPAGPFAVALAGGTRREAGIDVALLERGAEPPEGEERAQLRESAFRSGGAVAARLGADDRFVAVRPLAGALAGFAVEVALPTAEVREALAVFRRRLLVLALGVASAAAVSGLVLGRRLAEPVARLTDAATRIGAGDLDTPVDGERGAELGRLAEALDDMRSHLRRQTAELRSRQAESAAVLGGIAEGVFSVDRDRRVRYLNPQAAALLGLDGAAALGRFCGDVLRPASSAGVRPCEEHCPIVHARSRGGARAVEHLTLGDGTRRSVVITSSPPADALQFQVLRDETEGEAARRLRDAVLANISHEFKTPLSAQLASIELLADRLAQLPPAADGDAPLALVHALERGTLRLTHLVDNLLESARIEAGSHSIRRRPVALDEVVEEAAEWISPLLAQRGQRLEVELPFPLPAVSGDAPRLVQVLVNLLANANKFAPAGSAVRIGGSVAADTVALWIEDSGPGLPEMPGRSLFGRFVRAAGDDEPEQSGMGLGLWIAQSIVERHGGAIDVERVGERTRVAVRLPRERRTVPEAAA